MVFVTFGTQKHSFERLIKKIVSSKELENEDIIIQSGYTKIDEKYKRDNIEYFNFLNEEKYNEYIKKSEYVITHAGVGSILSAVKLNKKVLVVSRLKKYNEHMDDHQTQIAQEFKKKKFVLILEEDDDIDKKIIKLKNFNMKEFKEKNNYIEIIEKTIDTMID